MRRSRKPFGLYKVTRVRIPPPPPFYMHSTPDPPRSGFSCGAPLRGCTSPYIARPFAGPSVQYRAQCTKKRAPGLKSADGYIATGIVRPDTCGFVDRTFARTLPGSLPREMSRGPGKTRRNVRPNVRSGRDDSLTGEQSAVARRGAGCGRPSRIHQLGGGAQGAGTRGGRAPHLNIFQIQTAALHLPAQSHPRRPCCSLRYTGPITSDW